MSGALESVYVISGILLPLFYYPQIVRILRDRSNLVSYSLSKSVVQMGLRVPALFFAVLVLESPAFIFCVALDLVGRLSECAAAILVLTKQGATPRDILARMNPFATSHGASAQQSTALVAGHGFQNYTPYRSPSLEVWHFGVRLSNPATGFVVAAGQRGQGQLAIDEVPFREPEERKPHVLAQHSRETSSGAYSLA